MLIRHSRLLVLVFSLTEHQSTYSLQPSKRLGQLAPQVTRMARPSMTRPIAVAAIATQSGPSQMPASALTPVNQAITRDYGTTSRRSFTDKIQQQLWQREQERIAPLKEEVAKIGQKMGRPNFLNELDSGFRGAYWWERTIFPTFPIYSSEKLADFLKILDLLDSTATESFRYQLEDYLPKHLYTSFVHLPQRTDQDEWTSAVKNWLVAHPRTVERMLKDVPGHLSRMAKKAKPGVLEGVLKIFLEPYFLQAYEELVQDSRYRPFILNFFRDVTKIIKEKVRLDDYITDIFVNQTRLPKLAQYLRVYSGDELSVLEQNFNKNKLLRKTLEDLKNDPSTLSHTHFSKSAQSVLRYVYRSQALEQFIAALDKEADLLKRGYICFYHGQELGGARGNDVANKLFFRLVGIPEPDDFYFKQFLPTDFRIESTQEAYISKALERHALVMQQGQPEGWRSMENVPSLSANLFAFGNMADEGAQTLSYVARNANCRAVDICQPLRDLGVPDVILNKTYSLIGMKWESCESTARLVLIAVPLSLLDANVYPVIYSVGRDTRVPLKLGGNILKNMSDVINTITKEREKLNFDELDNFEVAIPLSSAGLLNPFSGIKLFNFDPEPGSAQAAEKLRQTIDEAVDTIMVELEKSGDLAELKKNAKRFYDLLPELAREGKSLANQDNVD